MKLLSFLNLLDRGQKLSLTNLVLFVLIVRVAVAPELSIADASVLFLGVLNYGHKRYESSRFNSSSDKSNKQIEALEKQISEVNDKVGKVSLSLGFNRSGK